MAVTLRIISSLISLYTFLCFIRIILTWIPGMSYNKITNALAAICDPYLNLFRNIKWLTIGSFNFSPALGLCLLSATSMLLTHFSHQGVISVGIILSLLVQIVWVMIHSIILFFMLLLLVRVILLAVNKNDSGNVILSQIDYTIKPIVYRMSSLFTRGKTISYQSALITALIMLLIVLVAGNVLVAWLTKLIAAIPF